MTDAQLQELILEYNAEQRGSEAIWFYRQVEKIKPKVIVEIGIKEGGNLKLLSTHLDKEGIAVGIDQLVGLGDYEKLWKMDDAECSMFHIRNDSHLKKTIEDLKVILNGRLIDVLFIDGDHTELGMLQDFKDYSPLVRIGGIIAVHDIYYLTSVADAWAKVPGNQRFESPVDPSHMGIGFIIKE